MPLWLELTEGLREAGLLVANGALHRTDTATTVRVRDGEVELTDGPFAVTKEMLGGFLRTGLRRPRSKRCGTPRGSRPAGTARWKSARSWTPARSPHDRFS